ncbi:MAG: hypothetical protein FWD15_02185 [Alphaproteobacteria bacterium]|nr:hypothetical protein [Alphaproteobacteria bacterium]
MIKFLKGALCLAFLVVAFDTGARTLITQSGPAGENISANTGMRTRVRGAMSSIGNHSYIGDTMEHVRVPSAPYEWGMQNNSFGTYCVQKPFEGSWPWGRFAHAGSSVIAGWQTPCSCQAGQYYNKASRTCEVCPEGTFSITAEEISAAPGCCNWARARECRLCGEGYYCTGGVRRKCPTDLTTVSSDDNPMIRNLRSDAASCVQGRFCPAGEELYVNVNVRLAAVGCPGGGCTPDYNFWVPAETFECRAFATVHSPTRTWVHGDSSRKFHLGHIMSTIDGSGGGVEQAWCKVGLEESGSTTDAGKSNPWTGIHCDAAGNCKARGGCENSSGCNPEIEGRAISSADRRCFIPGTEPKPNVITTPPAPAKYVKILFGGPTSVAPEHVFNPAPELFTGCWIRADGLGASSWFNQTGSPTVHCNPTVCPGYSITPGTILNCLSADRTTVLGSYNSTTGVGTTFQVPDCRGIESCTISGAGNSWTASGSNFLLAQNINGFPAAPDGTQNQLHRAWSATMHGLDTGSKPITRPGSEGMYMLVRYGAPGHWRNFWFRGWNGENNNNNTGSTDGPCSESWFRLATNNPENGTIAPLIPASVPMSTRVCEAQGRNGEWVRIANEGATGNFDGQIVAVMDCLTSTQTCLVSSPHAGTEFPRFELGNSNVIRRAVDIPSNLAADKLPARVIFDGDTPSVPNAPADWVAGATADHNRSSSNPALSTAELNNLFTCSDEIWVSGQGGVNFSAQWVNSYSLSSTSRTGPDCGTIAMPNQTAIGCFLGESGHATRPLTNVKLGVPQMQVRFIGDGCLIGRVCGIRGIGIFGTVIVQGGGNTIELPANSPYRRSAVDSAWAATKRAQGCNI